MIELSGYSFSTLREDELTLSRGVGSGLTPILLVAPAADQPSLAALRRLEHEYMLRTELDGAWAARPLALTQRGGRIALVLEDPGGEPLHRLIEGALEPGPFLRLAVPMAAAIHGMHEKGLIHRDIKPANLLVEKAGATARLMGFGIASRLPREHQPPEPPEVIAGTLPYMAPEQTGRMNRSIDSRSDLYALGVTLYEMLVGALPFTAADPMEWVHCHVARQPVRPAERRPGVPAQLSAIVMKLLAKTPEDRYQTAAGVAADLQHCLGQWEKQRRIDPFPLGTHDAPDRLLIPERLYGRAGDIATLRAAFARVVERRAKELVLISGYSGIGKSSLVNELHRELVPSGGLFAAGKFDQHKRDIPYATLAQAFHGLVHRILGKDEAELGQWRTALLEALGPNGQLMIGLVPDLASVIGEQPPALDLPPQDQPARFQLVFRRFLGVFARPEHPLVLFLDDLQWLDAASLDLLEHLALHPDVRNLLLVGAYRDNEVGPDHPLKQMLAVIGEQAEGWMQTIQLRALRMEDVEALVADALHATPDGTRPLAALLFEKTGGNPFFAIQFLIALAEQGLLRFDPAAGAWSWDLAGIRSKGFTGNVADLMAAKLERLPPAARDALGKLACLGNAAATTTLALVLGVGEDKVHEALGDAVRAGLAIRSDGSYAFVHDRVEEAAYALVPPGERAALHLRIARMLTALAPEAPEDKIFDIVNQFDRGAALLSSEQERLQVAALNLTAARRAKAGSAHAAALRYLAAGRALLGDRAWEDSYRLTFDLELLRAECEYLTGDLARAERRLEELLARARSTLESAAVTYLRLDLFMILDRADSAVEAGLAFLQRHDPHWPRQPTEHEIRGEYERLWQRLQTGQLEDLLDLPPMNDPDQQANMNVLTALLAPAQFTDLNLFRLVIVRMASLSLKHGNTDGSCLGYALLGGFVGVYLGNFDAGLRLGRIAIELVERHGFGRVGGRVYSVFALHVAHWTQHLRTCRAYLRRAFEAARDAGDLTFAAFARVDMITNLLATGEPLAEVEREAEDALTYVRGARFGLIGDVITAQLRLTRTLRGRTPDFGSFDDAAFHESDFEQHLRSNPRLVIAASRYWVRKLQARVVSGHYEAAVAAAAEVASLLWALPTQMELPVYHFFAALARAGRCNETEGEERAGHLQALAAHHALFAGWATSGPPNFAHPAALIGAELARLEGRELDAIRLYETAIKNAEEQGFVQNEGIASEHAARFYAARGFTTIADAYLRKARSCYFRWGAEGKLRQLERLHPHLQEEPAAMRSTGTFDAPIGRLDIGTVVKASQALSGEIFLGRLIETLMTIALQHAGAERGLLTLLRGKELRVEALATIGRQAVEVMLRQSAPLPAELPESILHTVLRTRQSLILEDARQSPFAAADPYMQRRQTRSVLCLPLIKQAELIGLLYLENSLAPGTFTAERIAVLELLASQAAISLENARLYEELKRSEAFLAEGQRLSQTSSWGWNGATGEVTWSPEHFRILGYMPGETSPSLEAFWQRVHPEDRPALEAAVEVAVRGRQGFDTEFRILRPDGSIRHIHGIGHVIGGESTDAIEFVGTIRDLTESKQAESALRSAQAELARVARLTTMGELAASIAHEINQPLGAIVANAEASRIWLERTPPEIERAQTAISRVGGDAMRAANVIRGLRALARKTGPEMASLDVNDAIQDVLALTRSEQQRHRIRLTTRLFAGDQPVFADRVQLQQVLLNLVLNGIEAMAEITDRPRELAIVSEPAEAGAMLISVEDTGPGLDPAIAERIFEPFFTTKTNGMGLGLSICRSIIEAHGGRFWASSRKPHGTAFRFILPAKPHQALSA